MGDFFYKFENFMPPAGREKMGAWGFHPMLDRDLAKKALRTKLDSTYFAQLQFLAKCIITGTGLADKDEKIKPTYEFVEDDEGDLTLFSQFFNVPGNACFLEFPHSNLEALRKKESHSEYIEFNPHNVDSLRQQYALASVWINWAKGIENILNADYLVI